LKPPKRNLIFFTKSQLEEIFSWHDYIAVLEKTKTGKLKRTRKFNVRSYWPKNSTSCRGWDQAQITNPLNRLSKHIHWLRFSKIKDNHKVDTQWKKKKQCNKPVTTGNKKIQTFKPKLIMLMKFSKGYEGIGDLSKLNQTKHMLLWNIRRPQNILALQLSRQICIYANHRLYSCGRK
jgi:hypothetical protein